MRTVLAAMATAALAGLAGCTGAAPPAAASSPPASSPLPGVTRVAVVGDSITEADSPDFDAGDLGPESWASYAGGDGVVVLGGWAHAGATTADMLDGVTEAGTGPVTWTRPDVLVLLAGNNDVDEGVPFAEVAPHLLAITRAVGARRVVLSALAPDDDVAGRVTRVNARLPALARRHGWDLVDPMAGVSDGAGHYLPGMTDDGVHPTEVGARLIGAALHPALRG